MRGSWRWLLPAMVMLGCGGEGGSGPGSLRLALQGQFMEGELTSFDVFVYDGMETECDPDTGQLSEEPSTTVDSVTDLSLDEPQEVSFTLQTGRSYVVFVRAGVREGGELDIAARGCSTVELSQRASVSVDLHRVDTCGDGDVDLQEMCDGGDRCDDQCRTVPFWVNDRRDFREGRQERPLAAGDDGLEALCWRSDYARSQQAPMAWFDAEGNDGEPFLLSDSDWLKRDCTSMDVLNGHVLMAYISGVGSPPQLRNMIALWNGQNLVTPVEVGIPEEQGVQAAFVSEESIVVLSETTYGLMLRRGTVGDEGVTIAEETFPVDSQATSPEAWALAGGADVFLVAWQAGNDVLAKFFEDVDQPAGLIDLCTESSRCSSPSVASLRGRGGDQFLVVYLGSNDRVVGRFVDMIGQESAEFEISDAGHCREPVVAPLDADQHRFVVAWTQAEGEDPYPARIYARIVTDVEQFAPFAMGHDLSSEPILVSPAQDVDADQPAVATAFGTVDPSTILVFYRALQGIRDDSDWDIGARLLRAARVPGEEP